MDIAVVKDNKILAVINLQQYLLEAIVKAHGGDQWFTFEASEHYKVGDRVSLTYNSNGSITGVELRG